MKTLIQLQGGHASVVPYPVAEIEASISEARVRKRRHPGREDTQFFYVDMTPGEPPVPGEQWNKLCFDPDAVVGLIAVAAGE